jgi:alkylation response protein AidB-like acyl-CoA dehydrogenase
MWKAARLLVVTTFGDIEEAVADGQDLSPTMRADMRVAATYATEASREIVQWAHLAGGTSAIREGSRLERAFRDMYTGTQHAFISEKVAIDVAQIWLGIIEDQPGRIRHYARAPRLRVCRWPSEPQMSPFRAS